MRVFLALIILVTVAVLDEPQAAGSPPTAGNQPTEPHVELLTMGRGDALLHRYGHAALCVVYRRSLGRTRCFNYGITDYKSPPQALAWQFLRGTLRFWVDTQRHGRTVRGYRREDRSVWIQQLPLSQAQVDRLVARLTKDLKESNRYYTYHHFDDNCSTRLRDHIDAVTGGALRKGGSRSTGVTYREMARRGMAEMTWLVVITNLVFGRRLDREVTVWESMFHPDHLRRVVHQRLGAKPKQVYRRKAKPPPTRGGSGWVPLALLALLLTIPVVATRLWGRFERLGLSLPAVILSLLGLTLWSLAAASAVAEMRMNEVLLVFWPSDLLLVVLGARRRQWYVRIRLAWLGALALGLLAGVLVQPLWGMVLMVAGPCLATARWSLPDAKEGMAPLSS